MGPATGLSPGELQVEVDQLFDLVPSAISIQDREYRIVRVNGTFRRLFGDRVGDRCYAAYKGRTEVCQDCPMARTFADGGVHQSEEVVRTASGEILQTAVQTAPILDGRGRVAGGMEVMTDISKTVATQQELVLLGQAMAGMAHYIKNVLTGLDGGLFVVEEAMESGDDSLLREGWEMVRRNVERVGKLSRDQLFCSREREPVMTEVAVNRVVCEAVELFRPRAVREGIELALGLDARLRTGWLDSEGVHRMVTNLVSNALDACRFDTAKARHWVSVKTFL
ncbi:MAG TPA: PAS domain-containing protein, partial [Acidobacteria bacterium]|nr:PAS domain-containing protein [Acidobacteriota bacterium]